MRAAAEISDAPPSDARNARVRRALVLFNQKAGSVGADARTQLDEALKAAGVEEFAVIDARRMSRRLFARAPQFDAIIVLGGDGTARAAAELSPRQGPPLILLPGGTLNILPKALYGDLAWPEALTAVLDRGVERRLPVGRANGEAFYVAGLFGAPTLLARARESVREGRPLQALGRFRHFLKRSFARRLRARAGKERMRKAEGIGVLCPSFSGGIESDHLEWVRLDAKHLLDLARVSLRALSKGWRGDSTIEIGKCETGDIYAPGIIPATLDGEPRTFISYVHISFDKRGPRVLALDEE
jgi:diacylglycerol kinase family enzyme